ncbi:hypothetical protein ADH70_020125 [Blautia pseudococcoides]|nr:hypothetical protein ADH70_020125 [Blautia pseudococcoides]
MEFICRTADQKQKCQLLSVRCKLKVAAAVLLLLKMIIYFQARLVHRKNNQNVFLATLHKITICNNGHFQLK